MSGSGAKTEAGGAQATMRRRMAGQNAGSSWFQSGAASDKAKTDRDYPNKTFTNIFSNAIAPLDFRKGKVVQGTALYVAAEVAVSKVLRKIMRADNKGYMELVAVHTVSLGLMGGITGAMSDGDSYGAKDFTSKIKGGAMGIPALFVAQYIYNTFGKGFHMPFWSMKDALIMAAAKILTRPILSMLYDKSQFTQNALDGQALLENMQARASNFKSKTTTASS